MDWMVHLHSLNLPTLPILEQHGVCFSDYPEALTFLAAFALVSIFLFRKHLELNRMPLQFVFGAICGGIAGNLGDRLFRKPAEVVDFIDVYIPVINYDYPIFNIADSAIFISSVFLPVDWYS